MKERFFHFKQLKTNADDKQNNKADRNLFFCVFCFVCDLCVQHAYLH